MMKKTWNIVLTVLTVLYFISCGGNDPTPDPVKLVSNPEELVFEPQGGTLSLSITSGIQPTVTCTEGWISIKQNASSGNAWTYGITAQENSGSTRTSSLRVIGDKQSLMIPVTQNGSQGRDAFVPPATAHTTAVTPQMVFDAMAPGWNMGNHMDAVNNGVAGETVWGNPKCTQATMNGVKAAGFKAVRICVTWAGHIGEAPDYKLDESWLSRVATIVGYAEKAGLVAIVNTHHDESYWLDISKVLDDTAAQERTKDAIFCVWRQIAERFKDKGDWLVLEAFNEIQDGGWGWSDAFRKNAAAQYKILNEWNQTFVDAVRSTGGENATRWLGIPGYAASPSFTIAGLKLPKDYTDANRLLVAVHDYDPYNYTLSDPLVRQWGHTADPALRVSNTDEASVVSVFNNLKTAYLDKGIPVYLGEMGCSRHADADFPYQKYYMEYFCKAAADRLLPMYVWDNGAKGTGSEKHAYIDHASGRFVDEKAETLVGLMVKAVTTKDAAYTLESVYDAAP